MEIEVSVVRTEIGPLWLASKGGVLLAAAFSEDAEAILTGLRRRYGSPELVETHGGSIARDIAAYFGGELGALDGIDVDPGGSRFQQNVWRTLRKSVPAGDTIAYGDLARRAGVPSAVRAVGAAMGDNPIPVAIPCHRVLRADGQLWRYGGGLERKRWLLEHEGALSSGPTLF